MSTVYPAVPTGCFQAYGHNERIFDVSFSPCDSNLLASASEDTTVRLWRRDTETGVFNQGNGVLEPRAKHTNTLSKEVAFLRGFPEEVYHVEFFDPSGLVCRPSSLPPAVAAAAASASPLEGSETTVQPEPFFRQVCKGKFMFTGSEHFLRSKDEQEVARDESHLLTASSESMYVWNLGTGHMIQKVDAPGTSGSTVPPDAIGEGYKHSYIFGCCSYPTTVQQRASRDHVSSSPAMCSGERMVATACSNGSIRLWSSGRDGHLTLQFVKSLPDVGMLTSCTFNSTGTHLAVTCRDGAVLILDPKKELSIVHHFKVGTPLLCCASIPADATHGRELLVLAGLDGRLRFHDWQDPTGVEPSQLSTPLYSAPLLAAAVSPSGGALAVAGEPTEMPPVGRPSLPAAAGKQETGPSSSTTQKALSGRARTSMTRKRNAIGFAATIPPHELDDNLTLKAQQESTTLISTYISPALPRPPTTSEPFTYDRLGPKILGSDPGRFSAATTGSCTVGEGGVCDIVGLGQGPCLTLWAAKRVGLVAAHWDASDRQLRSAGIPFVTKKPTSSVVTMKGTGKQVDATVSAEDPIGDQDIVCNLDDCMNEECIAPLRTALKLAQEMLAEITDKRGRLEQEAQEVAQVSVEATRAVGDAQNAVDFLNAEIEAAVLFQKDIEDNVVASLKESKEIGQTVVDEAQSSLLEEVKKQIAALYVELEASKAEYDANVETAIVCDQVAASAMKAAEAAVKEEIQATAVVYVKALNKTWNACSAEGDALAQGELPPEPAPLFASVDMDGVTSEGPSGASAAADRVTFPSQQ
eukprot:gene16262-22440_t